MFIKMTGPLDDFTKKFLASELDRLTAPEKYDLQVVKFGKRIRAMELAQVEGRVEGMGGETTPHLFEKMIKEMPEGHFGIVTLILGTDFVPETFLAFLDKYAKLKRFNVVQIMGTQTTKEVFDNFESPFGKPVGTA
jgi:hypothetical protein